MLAAQTLTPIHPLFLDGVQFLMNVEAVVVSISVGMLHTIGVDTISQHNESFNYLQETCPGHYLVFLLSTYIHTRVIGTRRGRPSSVAYLSGCCHTIVVDNKST